MMSSMVWGMSCLVARIGLHPLPTVPVSGQLHDAALLSRTVTACPHFLQVMMMPSAHTFYRRLGKARAYLKNM
jgi:hypothetical protein